MLDETGKSFTSRKFSQKIEQWAFMEGQNLNFIVGGAYGVDSLLKQKADHILSLSKMTYPHELARVVFLEQLYRAMTIIKGEKYHHA